MRIVAGRWRGRIIRAPADDRVRPTADRVREAWMSILQRDIPGARVLDLFAGSGALGLEALSRGAVAAEFVELHQRSLKALAGNLRTLGADSESVVHRGDAVRFIERLPIGAYDIAFADPPYGHGLAEQVVRRWLEVPFARVLTVEHAAREAMPGDGDTRPYGDTAITIFRAHDHPTLHAR
ncbi:MAG TPA: 16S rRNA (guanine(966)-N(2))-methyltransferase RsmD [Gemmatimonadaceae bacterium]|nr:16S rRNA (guanine(966)-N(2))-methyltransferase RsmD [Gemmatimonadaceae bacterium]